MASRQTFKVQVIFQKTWYALKGLEFPVLPDFLVELFGLGQGMVFLQTHTCMQYRVYSFKSFVCGLHQFGRTDVTTFKQFTQCSGIVQAQCIVLVKGMQACVFRGHCDFL